MNTDFDKSYIEGFFIGSIIYIIYFELYLRLKNKNKSKENKPIDLLNYIKTDNRKKMSYPKFINTNYFIFVSIFTYIYQKIKKNLKKRYI